MIYCLYILFFWFNVKLFLILCVVHIWRIKKYIQVRRVIVLSFKNGCWNISYGFSSECSSSVWLQGPFLSCTAQFSNGQLTFDWGPSSHLESLGHQNRIHCPTFLAAWLSYCCGEFRSEWKVRSQLSSYWFERSSCLANGHSMYSADLSTVINFFDISIGSAQVSNSFTCELELLFGGWSCFGTC